MAKLYKVVRVTKLGNMRSAIYRSKRSLDLAYVLNSTTTPKIGKVLCFATLAQAKAFRNRMSSPLDPCQFAILEGVGAKPVKMKEVAQLTSDIAGFWRATRASFNSCRRREASKGTVGVDSFYPRRLLYSV